MCSFFPLATAPQRRNAGPLSTVSAQSHYPLPARPRAVAEAEKMSVVKAAEADAESKRLSPRGGGGGARMGPGRPSGRPWRASLVFSCPLSGQCPATRLGWEGVQAPGVVGGGGLPPLWFFSYESPPPQPSPSHSSLPATPPPPRPWARGSASRSSGRRSSSASMTPSACSPPAHRAPAIPGREGGGRGGAGTGLPRMFVLLQVGDQDHLVAGRRPEARRRAPTRTSRSRRSWSSCS